MSFLIKLEPGGAVETKGSDGFIYMSGHAWRFERTANLAYLTVEIGLSAMDEAARVLGQQPAARVEQPELAAAISGLTQLLREKLP